MKNEIKKWKLSVVLLAFAGVYGMWFIYTKTVSSLIILLILLTAASVYFHYCTKLITLPGGYTVIQAQRFYKECVSRGLNSRNKLRENPELAREIAGKFDFAGGLDDDALGQLYIDGKAVESAEDKKKNKK